MGKTVGSATEPLGWYEAAALRVLLVDADPDTLEMYSEWLRLAGLVPFSAMTTEQAWYAVRTYRPHAIVSDIQLQRRFDGLELMQQILNDQSFSDTPILALLVSALVRALEKSAQRRRSWRQDSSRTRARPIEFEGFAARNSPTRAPARACSASLFCPSTSDA
jgi:CheY-like chemotaxis protein